MKFNIQESVQVKSESQEVQINHIKVKYSWAKPCTKFTGSVIDDDGNIAYYVNGQWHREDGPAVEGANGCKSWYFHGKLHREDGPAVEFAKGYKKFAKGYKEWYYNGELISDDQDYTLDDFQKAIIKLLSSKRRRTSH